MTRRTLIAVAALWGAGAMPAPAEEVHPLPSSDDLVLESASVTYLEDLDLLVFEQEVKGTAGGTHPKARGQMHGAPVLGYVFPTTLGSQDVGFGDVEGVVALAVTSHPDFDDTPLWDENGDRDYDNDGKTFHVHWVVLGTDERVPGGLSVIEFDKAQDAVVVPPTSPGMPLYLDSPGFSTVTRGKSLKVLVPAGRVRGQTSFRFDAVSAYMEVNTDDESRPMLGVYEVYSVLSEALSLPYEVSK